MHHSGPACRNGVADWCRPMHARLLCIGGPVLFSIEHNQGMVGITHVHSSTMARRDVLGCYLCYSRARTVCTQRGRAP